MGPMRSGPRTLPLVLTVALMVGSFLAFEALHEASVPGFFRGYLTSLLAALLAAALVWWMTGRRPRDGARALTEQKSAQIDRLTDALLAARAADGVGEAATRRLGDELQRAARYLSDETLAKVSEHVQDELQVGEGGDAATLALMLQFRKELGLAPEAETPAIRSLRLALSTLATQREAIAQVAASARQLFGALRKIAADEESEWRFDEPTERAGAAVIGFATTDGLFEGELAIPYPKEPRPRVEGRLEVRTAPHNLVVPERQRGLREALKKLGYARARSAATRALDPHDVFTVGVVFDHPDEPYLSRANNLVDLLDDTRDAIDAALA